MSNRPKFDPTLLELIFAVVGVAICLGLLVVYW